MMMDCEIKYCKSGLPASVQVVENMDDACFNVSICSRCAGTLKVKDGDDLMAVTAVHERLQFEYKDTPCESGRKG